MGSARLITPDGRTWVHYTPPDEPTYPVPLWRVLHDAEANDQTLRIQGKKFVRHAMRKFVPEVYTLEQTHAASMNFDFQWLCFNLLRAGAPSMSEARAKHNYRTLYDWHRAFTNKTGFEKDGSVVVDYVNGLDYTHLDENGNEVQSEEPRFDKIRVCGGATITGEVVGELLKVTTIDCNNIPPFFEVLQMPWLYFHATTVRPDGIGRFPQGDGEPVFVPLISDHNKGDVYYPLVWLERVDKIANPYEIK